MLTRKQIEQIRREPVKGRNRLDRVMGLAEVTQVELAAAMGVTQAYISKLSRGEYQDLPLETSRALAEFFGLQIADLFPSRQEVAS